MSKSHLFNWLNWRTYHARWLDQRRAALAENAEHHLWTEHPNDYREKDLGYQTIAGQRVRAKRVYETKNLKGPNWIVLGDEFKVSA